jgi:hypothetical protein
MEIYLLSKCDFEKISLDRGARSMVTDDNRMLREGSEEFLAVLWKAKENMLGEERPV